MIVEEPQPGETKINWQALEEHQEGFVILAHAAALKTNDYLTLTRIFNLGNPEIIFGDDYCRVAKESVDLMNMLTLQYLKR